MIGLGGHRGRGMSRQAGRLACARNKGGNKNRWRAFFDGIHLRGESEIGGAIENWKLEKEKNPSHTHKTECPEEDRDFFSTRLSSS